MRHNTGACGEHKQSAHNTSSNISSRFESLWRLLGVLNSLESNILLRVFFDPDLYETQYRFDPFFHSLHRNPLKLAVEVLAARKNVRAGEAIIRQLRAVGTAAYRFEVDLHACPLARLDGIVGHKRNFVKFQL